MTLMKCNCPPLILTLFVLAFAVPGASAQPGVTALKSDEQLVFFRTAAWLDEKTDRWHVPIHGWVFEPEDSHLRLAAFESALEQKFSLRATATTRANLRARFNWLIADNERGKRVLVNVAGKSHVMPETAKNGHFKTTLLIAVDELEPYVENHLLTYTAIAGGDPSRSFHGQTRLIAPRGVSVISDIDDTIKVTEVGDRRRLLERTFLLDFAVVPGMAKLLHQLAGSDPAVHFVSSSPWQLYPVLAAFVDGQQFPWASFSLKEIRFRDETLLNLGKPGTETKPPAIRRLLRSYPQRSFILVGDTGEQDPEVYATLLREYPRQISKVYLRNVTGETPDNARFKGLFSGLAADAWVLFDDPGTSAP